MGINSFDVGYYSFPGLSFNLTKRLSSPMVSSVQGYAFDPDLVAIASRNINDISVKSVFINPETQKIFTLDKLLCKEDNVYVFDIHEVNPLTVFSNIRLNSNPLDISGEMGVEVSNSLKIHWSSNGHNGRPLLQQIYNGISAGIGGFFSTKSLFEVRFDGLTHVLGSVSFESEATIGFSFRIDRGVNKYLDYQLLSGEIPLGTSLNYQVLGYQITAGLFFGYSGSITNISYEIGSGVDYFRGFGAKISKSVSFSSSKGIEQSDWLFDLTPKSAGSDIFELLDQSITSTKLYLNPQLIISLNLKISLGSNTNSLSMGIIQQFPFRFGFDKMKCVFPYLYGNMEVKTNWFLDFSGITILGCELIEPNSKNGVIMHISSIPSFCFIGKQSIEGLATMTQSPQMESYIVQLKNIKDTGYRSSKPKKSVLLEAYSESSFLGGYQYPSKDFKLEHTFPCFVVLFQPPQDTKLKITAFEEGLLFDTVLQSQNNLALSDAFTQGYQISYSNYWNYYKLSMDVFMKKIIQCDFQKEVTIQKNYYYYGFKNQIESSNIVVVTKISNGNYLFNQEIDFFDDSSTSGNHIQKGLYKCPERFIRMSISKFMYKSSGLNYPYFVRVSLNNDVIGFNNMGEHENDEWHSSQSMKIDKWNVKIPYFSSKSDSVKIEIATNSDMNDYYDSKTIYVSNLIGKSEYQFISKNQDVFINFKLESTNPYVISQINLDTYSHLMFVRSLSISTSITFTMFSNEMYVLLRFYNGNVFDFSLNNVFLIVSLPDEFIPLVDEFYDLGSGKKCIRIELKHVTDDNTANIVFRRQQLTEKSYKVEYINFFSSNINNSPFCDNFIRIDSRLRNSKTKFGCIHKNFNKIIWAYLYPSDKTGNQTPEFYTLNSDYYFLSTVYTRQNYQTSSTIISYIYALSSLDIPLKYPSTYMRSSYLQSFFDAIPDGEFNILCDRCSSIQITGLTDKSVKTIQKTESRFLFSKPSMIQDFLVEGYCNSLQSAYCYSIFTFSDPNSLTILEYPTMDGIIIKSSSETHSGILYESFHRTNSFHYLKLSPLPIIENDVISLGNYVFTLKYLTNGNYISIIAYYNSIPLPFSISKLIRNDYSILEFFDINMNGGFDPDFMRIDEYGYIVVHKDLIYERNQEYTFYEKNEIFELANIPADYVSQFVVDSPFYKVSQSSNSQAYTNYSSFSSSYSTISSNYNTFSSSYSTISSYYYTFSSSYSTFSSDYNIFSSSYSAISSDFASYESEYSTISSEYIYDSSDSTSSIKDESYTEFSSLSENSSPVISTSDDTTIETPLITESYLPSASSTNDNEPSIKTEKTVYIAAAGSVLSIGSIVGVLYKSIGNKQQVYSSSSSLPI